MAEGLTAPSGCPAGEGSAEGGWMELTLLPGSGESTMLEGTQSCFAKTHCKEPALNAGAKRQGSAC